MNYTRLLAAAVLVSGKQRRHHGAKSIHRAKDLCRQAGRPPESEQTSRLSVVRDD